MLLLLARHGNTFDPGDKVVWVGARTDLPLTQKGREQAEALGRGLLTMAGRIARILAGPLKRTKESASIAAGVLGFQGKIEIEERLREIDYGLWEAKSSEEIGALGDRDELKAWDRAGVWPSSPGWSPPQEALTANLRELVQALAAALPPDEAALLVTSNGMLRFFLKLVPGAFEEMAARGALKVATGNCCALRCEAGSWRLVSWNREPALAFE